MKTLRKFAVQDSDDTLIFDESDVFVCYRNHISNGLNYLFKEIDIGYRFRNHRSVNQIIGAPDIIFCDQSLNIGERRALFFIELKTKMSLPFDAQNYNLVDWWTMDHIPMSKASFQHIIGQVYGYLSFNKMKYGVLSTYEYTWFLRRHQEGVLEISEPIAFDSRNPVNLYQSIAYCIYLSIVDHTSVHSSPKSDSDPLEFEQIVESDSLPSLPTNIRITRSITKRKFDQVGFDQNQLQKDDDRVPGDFHLDIDRIKYIGDGSSGKVFKDFYHGIEVALKICDIYNNPQGLDQILHEVIVYNHLRDLQGVLIPRLIFSGYSTGIFILATSFIRGSYFDEEIINNARLKKPLQMLKNYGVEHGDLKPENILVRHDDQSIWIIDFGMATIN
jgi:predicted Ser/Thr protein kinase